MSEALTLTPETVEAIARRVAELINPAESCNAVHDHSGEPAALELVDAAEIARLFNVSRDYVYEHASELGAVRLGSGPKGRLRFDPKRVVEALAPRPFTPPTPVRRRPQRRAQAVELLPIGGKL